MEGDCFQPEKLPMLLEEKRQFGDRNECTFDLVRQSYVSAKAFLMSLDINTLLTCRLVCKNWNRIIITMSVLWKYWCQQKPLQLEHFPSVGDTRFFDSFMACQRILKGWAHPKTWNESFYFNDRYQHFPDSPSVEVLEKRVLPSYLLLVNLGPHRKNWSRDISNRQIYVDDLILGHGFLDMSKAYLRAMSIDGNIDLKIKTSSHMIKYISVRPNGRFVILTCGCPCNELRVFDDHLREFTVQVPIPQAEEDLSEEVDSFIGGAVFIPDVRGHLAICIPRTQTVTVVMISEDGEVLHHCHLRTGPIFMLRTVHHTAAGSGFVVLSRGDEENLKVEKIVVDLDDNSGMKTRRVWDWQLAMSVLSPDKQLIVHGVGKHFMLATHVPTRGLVIYWRDRIVARFPRFFELRYQTDTGWLLERYPHYIRTQSVIAINTENDAWLDGLSPATARPHTPLISRGTGNIKRLLWSPGIWGHLCKDGKEETTMNPSSDESSTESQDDSMEKPTDESLGRSTVDYPYGFPLIAHEISSGETPWEHQEKCPKKSLMEPQSSFSAEPPQRIPEKSVMGPQQQFQRNISVKPRQRSPKKSSMESSRRSHQGHHSLTQHALHQGPQLEPQIGRHRTIQKPQLESGQNPQQRRQQGLESGSQQSPPQQLGVWKNSSLFAQRLHLDSGTVSWVPGSVTDEELMAEWHNI